MKIINIIGNGENRLNFNMLKLDGYKIGCNASYRDHDLDCLVAIDKRLVTEALASGFKNDIYTRSEWMRNFINSPNVKEVPKLPYVGNLREDSQWHWGTGCSAANLAATMDPDEIHLWGFDLWDNNQKINNVYKGTNNYKTENDKGVDPRIWIYQLKKCFEEYPNITWVQNQIIGWKTPDEWTQLNLRINLS